MAYYWSASSEQAHVTFWKLFSVEKKRIRQGTSQLRTTDQPMAQREKDTSIQQERIQREGQGVRTPPPEKSQKYRVS